MGTFVILLVNTTTVGAYAPTYDVVLSDNGPDFYATTIGIWPFHYELKIQGALGTYTTYEGSGWSSIFIPFLGTFSLDVATAHLTNTAGFNMFKTYSTAGFTESFFYPYPRDDEGGPSSKLVIGWYYVNVQEG
ncbi:hypothetical protein [Thermococcus sp.]